MREKRVARVLFICLPWIFLFICSLTHPFHLFQLFLWLRARDFFLLCDSFYDNKYIRTDPHNSISWEYDPNTKTLSIDEYEKNRPARRSHIEMVLPRSVRTSMLRKEWDVTQRQIADAVRTNIKVKNQRRATVNNLDKADKVEEAMENAGRKLMRGLLMKKSTSQQVAELERQWQEAERQRKNAALQQQMAGEYDDDDGEEDEDPTAAEDEDSPVEEDEDMIRPAAEQSKTPTQKVVEKTQKTVVSSAKGKENVQSSKTTKVKTPVSDSSSDSRQSEGEGTAEATEGMDKVIDHFEC